MNEERYSGLFEEFDEISSKQWKQKIQVDLKGEDYNEKLVWESPEGIHVKPFYHQEDLQNLILPQLDYPENWKIERTIEFISGFNSTDIEELLKDGFESFRLLINDENFEFSVDQLKDLPAEIPIRFHLNCLNKSFKEVAKKVDIPVQFDPIAHLAKTGNWFQSLTSDMEFAKTIFADYGEFSVDTEIYQNAGANCIQQLAYGLAHAKEYCDLIDHTSPKLISFRVAIGPNYFFEIAKLRALRWLWKTLAKAYDWANCGCKINAIPSKRNKTIYDYNTNMLRSTTECMSAILGGADTIENLRYDQVYHKDNDFGKRIAKNQLLILKEESYFDAVSNPADGAYYIEQLTQQLANKALELFKEIEKSGGFLKHLKDGNIQKKIKECAIEEQKAFDEKVLVLVGSNFQMNTQDRMAESIETEPFMIKEKRKTLIEPIVEKRLSENLEKERLMQERTK